KSAKKSKDKTLWSIPLNVLLGSKLEISNSSLRGAKRRSNLPSSEDSHASSGLGMTKAYLMEKKNLHIRKPEGWIKVNAKESSFVRVDYPAKYLKLLREPIELKKLSV